MNARIIPAAATVGGLVGALALLGNVLDAPALASLNPGSVTMKANAAVGLLLLAGALVLSARSPYRAVGAGLALAAAALGAVTVLQDIVGFDLGIDRLLTEDVAPMVGTGRAGRMSPLTAASLVGLGIAIATLGRSQRARRVGEAAALLTLPFATFALVGLVYDVPLPLSDVTNQALGTALAVVALAAGAAIAHGGLTVRLITMPGAAGPLFRRGLPILVLTSLALGGLRIAALRAGILGAEAGIVALITAHIVLFIIATSRVALQLRRAERVTESALQRAHANEERLSLIGRVAIAAGEQATLEDALAEAIRITGGEIGSVHAEAWTAGEGDALRLAAHWTTPALDCSVMIEAADGLDLRRGEGLPGAAWRDRRPMWAEDVANDDRFVRREIAARSGLHAAVAVPISTATQVQAALLFFAPEPSHRDDAIIATASAVAGSIASVIEQHRHSDELRRSERARARLAAIVDSSPDAILGLTTSGVIMTANEGASTLFQVPAGSLIGRTLSEFMTSGMYGIVSAGLNETLKGARLGEIEVSARRDDGSPMEVAITMSEVARDGDTPPGIAAVVRDITSRKHDEALLVVMQEELRRSNRDLERFASIASHDLQEPLRVVRGFAELLLERYADQMDEDGRTMIEYIDRGVERARVLIADLLDFSRIGTAEIVQRAVDLGTVVTEAVDGLRLMVEETDAQISWNGLPTVTADPAQLVRVLQNLIGNAIKYRNGRPQIAIDAEREERGWVISVTDDGIGIDPKYGEQIFQIFQRLHRREEYSGTGMGLAIAKRIVERHGGRIWVRSAPGEGSTFSFTLSDGGDVGPAR